MINKLKKINLNDYNPEEFVELYVCALMLMAEDSSINDAHEGVELMREQLDFELMPVPPHKELH
jgi:hypothetical protein